jgi:hypothetical protein
MEERITKLERELAELKTIYYRDNFEAKQIFRKDVDFVGRIGFFNKTEVSQQASVATVGVPSGTYQQSEANNTVTAVNAIIARLQAYGLLP